jgi:hypothetical protein
MSCRHRQLGECDGFNAWSGTLRSVISKATTACQSDLVIIVEQRQLLQAIFF